MNTLVAIAMFAVPTGDPLPAEVIAVIEKARTFEIISIDPVREPGINGPYHGFRILGRTEVKSKRLRNSLIASLTKGMKDAGEASYLCFEPRHAIRAVTPERSVDVLICFECLQVEAHLGTTRYRLRTTRSPEPAFDKVLKDAGVPLAPKGDD